MSRTIQEIKEEFSTSSTSILNSYHDTLAAIKAGREPEAGGYLDKLTDEQRMSLMREQKMERAEEATQRLGLEMASGELLNDLTIEQVGSTNFIRLTYEHTNPVVATEIANTMANVSSERISDTSNLTATVHEKARVPDYPAPVSPNPLRNGLITLVASLALSAVLIAGHSWAGSATFGIRPRR